MKRIKKFLFEHSLSIVLISVLVFQTFIFWFSSYPDGNGNVQEGVTYWDWFISEYMLSTLADTYGMVLIVLLTKWFTERGSKEG